MFLCNLFPSILKIEHLKYCCEIHEKSDASSSNYKKQSYKIHKAKTFQMPCVGKQNGTDTQASKKIG